MYHSLRDYDEWGNVFAIIISDKETKDFQKVIDAKKEDNDIGWIINTSKGEGYVL